MQERQLSTHCGRSMSPSHWRDEDSSIDPRFACLPCWSPLGRAGRGRSPLAGVELHDRSATVGHPWCDPGDRRPRAHAVVAKTLGSKTRGQLSTHSAISAVRDGVAILARSSPSRACSGSDCEPASPQGQGRFEWSACLPNVARKNERRRCDVRLNLFVFHCLTALLPLISKDKLVAFPPCDILHHQTP